MSTRSFTLKEVASEGVALRVPTIRCANTGASSGPDFPRHAPARGLVGICASGVTGRSEMSLIRRLALSGGELPSPELLQRFWSRSTASLANLPGCGWRTIHCSARKKFVVGARFEARRPRGCEEAKRGLACA
jgi:hypothetical protein